MRCLMLMTIFGLLWILAARADETQVRSGMVPPQGLLGLEANAGQNRAGRQKEIVCPAGEKLTVIDFHDVLQPGRIVKAMICREHHQ